MKERKPNKILEQYKSYQDSRKKKIAEDPSKWHRFWKRVWFWVSFPFVWIFYNVRDWRTAVVMIICFLILSSEVWVPYLMALITWGTDFSKWCLGFASACWLFWLGPGTPFTVILVAMTIAVKALMDKIYTFIVKKRSVSYNADKEVSKDE